MASAEEQELKLLDYDALLEQLRKMPRDEGQNLMKAIVHKAAQRQGYEGFKFRTRISILIDHQYGGVKFMSRYLKGTGKYVLVEMQVSIPMTAQ
jgi:adenylate kinase